MKTFQIRHMNSATRYRISMCRQRSWCSHQNAWCFLKGSVVHRNHDIQGSLNGEFGDFKYMFACQQYTKIYTVVLRTIECPFVRVMQSPYLTSFLPARFQQKKKYQLWKYTVVPKKRSRVPKRLRSWRLSRWTWFLFESHHVILQVVKYDQVVMYRVAMFRKPSICTMKGL